MSTQGLIVIGGGIGGMAVALALAKKGRRIRLLEKAPEFGEIGYGIQCGPNAYRMFEYLGVMKTMEPRIFRPNALVWGDAMTGKEITRIDLGVSFQARYGRPYFVVHRRDLHGALWEACKRQPNISLNTSKGLVSFRETASGVQVRCEDGSAYEGAAVIAADGLRSVARASIVGDGSPRVSGHVAYRGVVPFDSIVDKRYQDSMVMWVGPHLHLVQYRLEGGTVMNNVAVIESQQFLKGAKEWGGPDELDQIFSSTDSRIGAMLTHVGRDRNWPLYDREPVGNWTQGKVTLLGDAAHPTLQYLAQGACMAIEDSVVLAEKIGSSTTDFNQAFLAYQKERYLRTARVVYTSRIFGELCHAVGVARELRNEIAGRRDPTTSYEVDWLYRGIQIPQ